MMIILHTCQSINHSNTILLTFINNWVIKCFYSSSVILPIAGREWVIISITFTKAKNIYYIIIFYIFTQFAMKISVGLKNGNIKNGNDLYTTIACLTT